ncbi:ParB N-terminal domain-containing protein [Roseibaca sp. Y0-43]|uniref:ParB N-terminal domain-containing protein n=1 Tax=Roseibaca sp. Y0-43 TaxID=2816854 RepID=UPI001D0C9F22|nr:ParB N-terminal domain-containing protein [Roseibaca sp. Y0-43]MCC1482323.1 ParB N-terminal domain-containing protein [Roseibaca sp. Y0-43]
MTAKAKTPRTPTYRRANVNLREINFDPEFSIRDIQEHHVRTLVAALRTKGKLDPILLLDDKRNPEQPKLTLIDGHHRVAAYKTQQRSQKHPKPVNALIVSCDEITAHRLAAQRNSKDKLPLTTTEKLNLAWKLVWLSEAALSKAEIVNDTGVSRTTVHNMRKRRRQMLEAGKEPTGEWWKDSKDNSLGTQEETDLDKKLEKYVDALKGPAEAMRREPAEVKWGVLEYVFGTYEARQIAWHGIYTAQDDFELDAPQLEHVITELDENCDF